MDAVARIEQIVGPSVEGMGYELVRVQMSGGQRPTLQIMAERQDGRAMTVDDCADISRAVSALLDVEDPLPGAYTLEVSSPGIDRPLTRLKDFERFKGFEARIETKLPLDGRRRFRGLLDGVEGADVRLSLVEKPSDGGKPGARKKAPTVTASVVIPFHLVLKAKLELTEELLKAAAAEQAAAGAAGAGVEGGEMEVDETARPARRPPRKKGPGRFAKGGRDDDRDDAGGAPAGGDRQGRD